MGFIPLYVHVSKQAIGLQQEIEAIHLLYETTHQYILEGVQEDREGLLRGEYEFTVLWVQDEENSTPKVCVHYESAFEKTVKKCETIE